MSFLLHNKGRKVMTTKKRLFVAIELPKSLKTKLGSLQKNYHIPDLRWIPLENLHITLYFFGEIDEKHLEPIKKKLTALTQSNFSFSLTLESFTPMPPQNPRMIWAHYKSNSQFANLVKQIRTASIGITSERKNKQDAIPHITCARSKKPIINIPIGLRSVSLPPLPVTEIALNRIAC